MDLSVPTLDSVEATRLIRERLPDPRILVLTSFSDTIRVRNTMHAGAIGYLLKDCGPLVLIEAIRSAARGYDPLGPRVAGNLLPTGLSKPPQPSPREREILTLVAEGTPNKQRAWAAPGTQ
jgi:DNA-binding NarL/FixJ family response regulator